jgi:MtN3 and saliva related transmembrane protein
VAAYIGYFAGILTVVSFLPQLVRTWRTKHARDLSSGMILLLTASGGCWTLYGVLTADRPVIATNLGVVVLTSTLFAAKIRYRRNTETQRIGEKGGDQ